MVFWQMQLGYLGYNGLFQAMVSKTNHQTSPDKSKSQGLAPQENTKL